MRVHYAAADLTLQSYSFFLLGGITSIQETWGKEQDDEYWIITLTVWPVPAALETDVCPSSGRAENYLPIESHEKARQAWGFWPVGWLADWFIFKHTGQAGGRSLWLSVAITWVIFPSSVSWVRSKKQLRFEGVERNTSVLTERWDRCVKTDLRTWLVLSVPSV